MIFDDFSPLVCGLDEMQWYDVIRELKPDITQAEFDQTWRELIEVSQARFH